MKSAGINLHVLASFISHIKLALPRIQIEIIQHETVVQIHQRVRS